MFFMQRFELISGKPGSLYTKLQIKSREVERHGNTAAEIPIKFQGY